MKKYYFTLDSFDGLKRVESETEGDHYEVEEVDNLLQRQELVMNQLRDDKTDHERFVSRLKQLMDAELFDDARAEVMAEYTAIHGPSV